MTVYAMSTVETGHALSNRIMPFLIEPYPI